LCKATSQKPCICSFAVPCNYACLIFRCLRHGARERLPICVLQQAYIWS
jgi:hypothetical protein